MLTLDQFVTKWTGKGIDLLRGMNLSMFSSGNEQKIFNPIVGFIMVNMMDYLNALKKAAQLFFHYQSVFCDAIIMSKGMMRLIKKNVFSFISDTALPVIMIGSFVKDSHTFIRAKPPITNTVTFKDDLTLLTFPYKFAR